ncbi:MAG: hypothetical protein KUG65_08220 [Sphingomonadaceae bacterium]|nr:hypothetical protein [Sphingomonadaceae bacterium]
MTIIQPQGAIVDLETGPPGDIAFSIDSKTVYVAKGGTIGAYDAVTGIEEQSWTIGTQLGGIDVSLDGKYLVATELQVDPVNQPDTSESISDIHVYRLDLETGVSTKFTTQVEVYANPFFDVSFMPDGKALLTHPHIYAFTDTLTTLNFETGIFSAVGQDEKVYGQLSSTPDKSHFIMTPANHSGGPVFLYTAESGITAENRFVLRGNNNGAQAISPSGDMVVQGVGLNVYDGDLQLLTNLADAFPRLAFNVAGLAFSPDEDRLYLLDDKADSIYVFRTSDWSLIDSIRRAGRSKISTPWGMP